MSFESPYGLKTTNPVPAAYWEGPYESLEAARAAVLETIRYPTMKVSIVPADGSEPYIAWWKLDLTDAGLVKIEAAQAVSLQYVTISGSGDCYI